MAKPDDGLIFGYTWDAIKAAQQGGRLVCQQPRTSSPEWTAMDQALLDEHGSAEALEAAGFHGAADRLRRGFGPSKGGLQ